MFKTIFVLYLAEDAQLALCSKLGVQFQAILCENVRKLMTTAIFLHDFTWAL